MCYLFWNTAVLLLFIYLFIVQVFLSSWANLTHLCLSVPTCNFCPALADCRSINSVLLDYRVQADSWGLDQFNVSTHSCSTLTLHVSICLHSRLSKINFQGLNLKDKELELRLIAISKDHCKTRVFENEFIRISWRKKIVKIVQITETHFEVFKFNEFASFH